MSARPLNGGWQSRAGVPSDAPSPAPDPRLSQSVTAVLSADNGERITYDPDHDIFVIDVRGLVVDELRVSRPFIIDLLRLARSL